MSGPEQKHEYLSEVIRLLVFPACARCKRSLHSTGHAEWLEGLFAPESWAERSRWQPDLCQSCDTEHDHTQTPGRWHRLKLWLQGYDHA